MPDPYRENPTEKHPYTVVCVIPSDTCTLVSKVWAFDANDAYALALQEYRGEEFGLTDAELIGVFYGHVEFCVIEDDYRVKWFHHPIVT